MVLCYLCRSVLSDNYRKRKRVKSCPVAVGVLKKICDEIHGNLEICDPNALFCTSCEQQLNNIHSYESKTVTWKMTIEAYLQGHPEYSTSTLSPALSPATQSRPFPPEEPPPKQPCLTPSYSASASPSVKVGVPVYVIRL